MRFNMLSYLYKPKDDEWEELIKQQQIAQDREDMELWRALAKKIDIFYKNNFYGLADWAQNDE